MSKKESYWFSHDSNASNNPKLLALLRKYGFEGYGRWWRLLERLRECEGYRYDISVPFAWEVLGADLQMDATEAEAFVRECMDYFGLLQSDGKYFWSGSLVDRMEFWERRREVLRERGRKGGLSKKKDKDGDENNPGTDEEEEVQAKHKQSTAKVKLKLKQANETKQNDTKQNHTKPNDVVIEGGIDEKEKEEADMNDADINTNERTAKGPEGLELLRHRALADAQRFVYPYVSTGRVNKEQLADWLTAFNKWLEFTGEDIKEERDYRRHFAAWFRYRDVRKENPKTYNPAGQPVPLQPPAQTSMPLPVLLPDTPPKGKYSSGDNKYDMHWLKNLRDEVRSMGG